MRVSALALCLIPGAVAADPPRVVVDIAPVHSVVAAVMHGVAEPALIVPPTASPHGYSLRPSEARALDHAELVVWMGPALANWMEGPIETLGAQAEVLTLLDVPGTQLLGMREGAAFEAGHEGHDHGEHGHEEHGHEEHGHEEHGHDDTAHAKDDEHADHADHAADKDDHSDHGHEDGHDHEDHADNADDKHDHDDHAHAHNHSAQSEGADPHAWLDPRNAVTWADAIATQLSNMDPENAGTYAANAVQFAKDMAAVEADIRATLASVQGRPFVVFHDAYHYFEERFGVEAVGAVSASDAASASAGRVAELRARIDEFGAVCALTEPQFNPGLMDAVGATKLGEIDPIGATLTAGPDLYPALLRNMGSSLAECLQ
ncbi:zinc ABC transporter substrate-binding protein [uncultured Tateyamaria sp.]|uniref:zinc ABC transporter substrate-binding protein n=1 Tax=Tateyamaria sp. 1078 TaxID=3417464 RepID=UPI00260340FE|nr:zinc ABC transporter substrate-binding protein [uncultured Tateyamaria sp.]